MDNVVGGCAKRRKNKGTRHVLPSPPIPQLPKGSSQGGLNLPRGDLCRSQATGQSETPKLYQTPRNIRMIPQQPTPVGSTLGSGLLPHVSLDPLVPLSICTVRPRTYHTNGTENKTLHSLGTVLVLASTLTGVINTHGAPVEGAVNTQCRYSATKTTGFRQTKLG